MNVEEAILGTIMAHPHLMLDSGLKTEHFQNHENRRIFEQMYKLQGDRRSIDLVSLLTVDDPINMGGAGKLNRISTLSNENKFDSYVELLMDKWRENEKRHLLQQAMTDDWNIEKIVGNLDSLTDNKVNDYHSLTELLAEIAEDPWNEKEITKGISTGLSKLQIATNGWQNGELTIIAARPSMGKTDVMLHFAKQAGWNNAIPIIFSLEMAAELLRDRMIASTGNYNRSKMKDLYNRLSEAQKKTWMSTLSKLGAANIETFDRSGQTLSEMRMKVRKVKSENQGKQLIVFIDYLTLIKPYDNYNGNMHLAISDISKGLKSIAKEFNCPVISLAQLSRSVEKRNDKRPILSDLRESGSIEEDADVVMFLYRDAYYSKAENDNTLEIILAKNRNGETGTINAVYNKFTGAISDES